MRFCAGNDSHVVAEKKAADGRDARCDVDDVVRLQNGVRHRTLSIVGRRLERKLKKKFFTFADIKMIQSNTKTTLGPGIII